MVHPHKTMTTVHPCLQRPTVKPTVKATVFLARQKTHHAMTWTPQVFLSPLTDRWREKLAVQGMPPHLPPRYHRRED